MDKNNKKISIVLLFCLILILGIIILKYVFSLSFFKFETFEDKRQIMKRIYKNNDIQDPDEDPDDEGDDPDTTYGVDPDDLLIYRSL